VKGFAYSGPDQGKDIWYRYRESAEKFFKDSGLEVSSHFADCPAIAQISSPQFVMYYAIAHGDYQSFECETGKACTASDIQNYMKDRGRMGFAFLGHCRAMVKTGWGTFSQAFSKGYSKEVVIIGYYYADKSAGWKNSLKWQERLFFYIREGMKLGEAFSEACADYPEVKEMVKFVGDKDLTLEGIHVREKEITKGKGCLVALFPI